MMDSQKATDSATNKVLAAGERSARNRERMAALERMAGGIAHKFSNVLMTLILYADMLLQDPSLPAELVPHVESILEETQEAHNLMRRMLDFAGRSAMESRLLDLCPFLQQRVNALRRNLPESVQLLLEVGPGEYGVNADPTCLEQVLMNLVDNARGAMPEGGELGIELFRVALERGQEPPVMGMAAGDWVCLAVSDQGAGIPPEALPHLFEPFSSESEGEGRGLGLAQVYGIVKQHEGHIGVETQVGRGTTFRVYLPAQPLPRAELAPQRKRLAPAPREETILLVEDEPGLRRVTRMVLESLGYQVLVAANGIEALEVYRSAESVDLLVTAMVMPEMGGKELIRELRKMNPRLKVVAVTGSVTARSLRSLQEEGRLEIVHKPIDRSSLGKIVRQALYQD